MVGMLLGVYVLDGKLGLLAVNVVAGVAVLLGLPVTGVALEWRRSWKR